MTDATRSLSRPVNPLGPGKGPDYPFLRPLAPPPRRETQDPTRPGTVPSPGQTPAWSAQDAKAAMEFLSQKPRWPGATVSRVALIEAELKSMSQAERVFLEIEMTRGVKPTHSYDYDPLVLGRY